MSKLTEEVKGKLDGLYVRQLLRDASRRQAAILRRAYKFRKAGRFDSFDAAITLVQEEFGWESNLEEYYGVKILHLQCGMTLAYDPTGKLSWASAPRLKQEAMGSQVEMEFIRIARKTPPFRAGMQSADSEAVLNVAFVAAQCTGE
jgi:hypothetical protein